MTPEEERAEIISMSLRIDEDLRDRFSEIMVLILGGMAVKAAVQQVIGDVEADMAAAMSPGFSVGIDPPAFFSSLVPGVSIRISN